MNTPIQDSIQHHSALMQQVNDFVYSNPELGYEEDQCAQYLVGVLRDLGLDVDWPFAGISTSFKATLTSSQGGGPSVGLVMLYDAVPAVDEDGSYLPNHSCGHSVISGAVVGAVAALTQVPRAGSVTVIGLPGDEIGAPLVAQRGGSKALTAAAGEWDTFDAVYYAHPEFDNTVSQVSRWMERYRLSLHSPRNLEQHGELDGSVLWAVQAMLSEVRSMEERHTQEFVMVKNLSVNGDVENDCRISAHMQILLFGLTNADVGQRVAELETAVATVRADAQIRIDLQRIGEPYIGVVPNQTLTRVVEQAMADMQLDVLTHPEPLPFATDFGNISRRAPSALIGTGRQGGWQFHNLEGDREFRSSDGQHVMVVTAEVLARAITGFWEDPGIVAQARTDFEANIGSASP